MTLLKQLGWGSIRQRDPSPITTAICILRDSANEFPPFA